MSLTYGLRTASDLYSKLRREADRLELEITSDNFFNFIVTGLHLVEWIEKDPSIPDALKPRALSIRDNPDFKVCSDLANASKHFVHSKRNLRSADSEKGYGVGRYGAGGWGEGEEAITIVTESGATLDALSFRDRILKLYSPFFSDRAAV